MEVSTVQQLLFMDDLMLVARRMKMWSSLEPFHPTHDKMADGSGFETVDGKVKDVNYQGKTYVLTAQSSGGTCDVSVEGEKIEEVKVMQYLGALFNEEGSCEQESETELELYQR